MTDIGAEAVYNQVEGMGRVPFKPNCKETRPSTIARTQYSRDGRGVTYMRGDWTGRYRDCWEAKGIVCDVVV